MRTTCRRADPDPPGAEAGRAVHGCLAGGATLTELRQSLAEAESEATGGLSPRVFPFADVRDMGGLLQRAGFALPVADSETVTVRYGMASG